jgi:hypothetical protein
MASGKSTYLSNKFLDLIFGAVAFTAPTTVYAALMTASASAAGGGTEVPTANTNYSRVAITNNLTDFPSASAGQKQNANAITFPVLSGSGCPTGTVVQIAFYDAATAGNLLYFCDLATAYQKAYAAYDQPVIPAAAFTASES